MFKRLPVTRKNEVVEIDLSNLNEKDFEKFRKRFGVLKPIVDSNE